MDKMPTVLPPKVRVERDEVEIKDGKVRVRNQRTIDRALSQELIEQKEFDAAERLYADYYYGNLEFSSIWIKEVVDGTSGEGYSDRLIQARERFHNAMHSLSDKNRHICWQIVCFDYPLSSLGYRKGQSGLALSLALSQLVHFYENKR